MLQYFLTYFSYSLLLSLFPVILTVRLGDIYVEIPVWKKLTLTLIYLFFYLFLWKCFLSLLTYRLTPRMNEP